MRRLMMVVVLEQIWNLGKVPSVETSEHRAGEHDRKEEI